MSKRIFIAFGHNNHKPGSSFNAAVRDAFIEEAKKLNHEIDLINIYGEKPLSFGTTIKQQNKYWIIEKG